MSQRLNLGYLFLIILVVILPTAFSLGWYKLSNDPNLRPLAITKQALRAYNSAGEGVEIVAVVDWVALRTGNYTKANLTHSLVQSFAAKGVDVRIEFREGRNATQVTYVVGKTVVGPFSTARASEGISAAVEAYKMY